MDRGIDCGRGSMIRNLEVDDRILQPVRENKLAEIHHAFEIG